MKKFLILFLAIGLIGCNHDDDSDPDYIPPHKKTNRTVLAYLVGDINLWDCIETSVNQLEAGWNDEIDGSLLVYLDHSEHLTQFGRPVLLEITHDTTELIVSKVVKMYDDQDAGDPKVMQSVLKDAITLYPAKSQGLIIGSHGNGWLPEIENPHDSKSLSGSERYGSSLEIAELAEILPVKYEFIMFHACNMSNIETAYQLRNKCDFMVASALPLPGYGYPYETIIPYLYTKPYADLYKAALMSAKDYDENKDKSTFDGFTVSVIQTSELENLADATSRLLKSIDMSYDEMREFLKNNEMSVVYYEGFLSDMSGLYFVASDDNLKAAYQNALKKAIVQYYFVPGESDDAADVELMSRIEDYGSGISLYLPNLSDIPGLNQLNTIFKRDYAWAKASGFDQDKK